MKALIGTALVLALSSPAPADQNHRFPDDSVPQIVSSGDAAQRSGPVNVPPMSGWNIDVADAVETSFAEGVCIVGNYVYVGFTGVITVLDITNPALPVKVGFALTPGRCVDFCQRGDYLFCGNYPESFVQIFDISNRAMPSLVASIPSQGYSVDVDDDHLYMDDGNGLRIYDVSTPANPISVGFIAIAGIYDLDAADGYVYVGKASGLQVIDATDPGNPIQVSTAPINGGAWALQLSGNYVYAVTFCWPPGFCVIDVANKNAPSVVKLVSVGCALDLVVRGTFAFVVDDDGLLLTLDISDPLNPVPSPSFSLCDTPYAASIDVANNIAAVADNDGVCFVDVSNPANPNLLERYDSLRRSHSLDIVGDRLAISLEYGALATVNRYDASIRSFATGHGGFIDVSEVVVQGEHAYVAMCDSWNYAPDDALEIFDVSDSATPVFVGHLNSPWCPSALSAGANHVYMTTNTKGLWVVDVSNASLPTKVGEMEIWASDLFAVEPYLFATGGGSLRVLDVSNPTLPFMARSLPLGADSYGLWVAESLAYVASGAALWVVDISDPLQPSIVGSFPTTFATSVRVRDQFAYLSDYPLLRILDVSNPSLPVEVGNIETFGVRSRVAVAPPYIYALTDDGPLLKLETPLITNASQATRKALTLEQNHPNPFNPSTTISFETPSNGRVRLDIFDVRGSLVRRLVDESMPTGAHSITWDGRDSSGNPARSGVYFYRLEANGKSEAKKMVILK